MTLLVHLVIVLVVFVLGKTVGKSLIKKYVFNWDELTAGRQVKRWLLFGVFSMALPFYVAAVIATEVFGFSGSKFFHTLPHLLNFYYFSVFPKGKEDKWKFQYYSAALVGTFLNPFQFWQSLCHTFGQFTALLRKGNRLPKPQSYKQETVYTLPFKGQWTVVNGGVDPITSHSWWIINQRYAYDFCVTGENGRTYKSGGECVEDYYAFGQPVIAPADGRVVAVKDGIRDYPKPGSGWIDWQARDFRGNFVVLKHAEREYSFLAHLVKGSIQVKPGDVVKRGQVVGLCGNSGHSTEPHLHFHIQDHPNFFFAVSLPILFNQLMVADTETKVATEQAYLTRGQRVAPIFEQKESLINSLELN